MLLYLSEMYDGGNIIAAGMLLINILFKNV